MEITNKIFCGDCMQFMSVLPSRCMDFTLTDIPYSTVNRTSNGLRNLNKGKADIMTFELKAFLDEIYRLTANSICVFCGKEQFSKIFSFFAGQNGTVRPIIWEKKNPSPMNGQRVYLSGVEMGVWFKKRGARIFNAHCKNTVFRYPNGSSKLHPTEKNHGLLRELILDNTGESGIVFDPCMGSGSHLLEARNLNRRFIGCELNKEYYALAFERIYNDLLFWQRGGDKDGRKDLVS